MNHSDRKRDDPVTVVDNGATDAVTVEEARRSRRGLRYALGALDAVTGAPALGRIEDWVVNVRNAILRVSDALDHHIATTEAVDGLFAEMLAQDPRLEGAVRRLRDDHVKLREIVVGLALRCEDTVTVETVDAIRLDTLELQMRCGRHRQKGADLVYEAFTVDVSTGD